MNLIEAIIKDMSELYQFTYGVQASLKNDALETIRSRIENTISDLECLKEDIEKEIEKTDLLDKPISYLNLVKRTDICLLAANIKTIGELIECSEIDVLKMPNMGEKSKNEIIAALNLLGLHLRGSK